MTNDYFKTWTEALFNELLGIWDNIPDESGIYAVFYDSGELIYIGSTVCLNRRLNSHEKFGRKTGRGWAKPIMNHFKVRYLIKQNPKDLEKSLIIKHKPKRNHVYNINNCITKKENLKGYESPQIKLFNK